jgi:flavin-dependent dehydrogenase
VPVTAADICIIGGGPAGCAAALTIGRYTKHSCVVLDAGGAALPRAGEVVSAAMGPLLEYLGINKAADVFSNMVPSLGTEALWGNTTPMQRDSLWTGHGPGWSLDRAAFDSMLLSSAEAVGVCVFRGALLQDSKREDEDENWCIAFNFDGEIHHIKARHVIDASGRRRAFARQRGTRTLGADRLIGVVTELPCGVAKLDNVVTIEAISSGWWYATPTPNDRAMLVFMTDADLFHCRPGTSLLERFSNAFLECKHLASRIALPTQKIGLRVHMAGGQLLDPCMGPNWIAAGDSACSHDPISSIGIGHAIMSGIQAARIVDARLVGEETLALAYPRDILSNHMTYLSRRRSFYLAEQRWPDSPFWKRRHGNCPASPLPERESSEPSLAISGLP